VWSPLGYIGQVSSFQLCAGSYRSGVCRDGRYLGLLTGVYILSCNTAWKSAISAFFLAWLLSGLSLRGEKTCRPHGAWVCWPALRFCGVDNLFVVWLLGVWFVVGNCRRYLRTSNVVGDTSPRIIAGLLSYYLRMRPDFSIRSMRRQFRTDRLGFIFEDRSLFI